MEDEILYQTFIDWKARPKPKEIPNIEAFCKEYKIKSNLIVDFLKRPDFTDRLGLAALEWAKSKVPELLHIAFQEARDSKDLKSIETFTNLTYELKQLKKNQTNNQINIFNLTDDKYKQIAERAVRGSIFSSESSTGKVTELLPTN